MWNFVEISTTKHKLWNIVESEVDEARALVAR